MSGAYTLVVMLHLLGASVWVGGHLILSCVVLPPALRHRDPAPVVAFERRYNPLWYPALLVQFMTGLWLAHYWLPDWQAWFRLGSPQAALILGKFGLLGLTALLGCHARWRLMPQLTPATLPRLSLHIVSIALLGVAFVIAGSGIRLGGLSW